MQRNEREMQTDMMERWTEREGERTDGEMQMEGNETEVEKGRQDKEKPRDKTG